MEIYICTEGKISIKAEDVLTVKKGESFFVYADAEEYVIEGKGTLYRADVPL